MRTSLLVSLLAFTLACGPGAPEAIEIANTPLAGTVAGLVWSPTAAGTNPVNSDNLVFSTTFATGLVEDECTLDFTPPLVLTRLPTTPGEYPIDSNNSVIFTLPAVGNGNITNRQATEGAIRIDSVDIATGRLTGAIKARADDENDIEGTFEATICVAEEEEI